MGQTFRTDPETGRTVISQDNVVGRQMAGGERIDNRFATDDPRSSYDTMSAPTRPGTGYMARSEFESLSGMTETNPYGNDGFFSRVFGIDPNKIDYTNTLGTQGIANVKRMAYDRFMNPFAQVDVFGNPTMGASEARGTTRSGVQPGDLTIFGPAAEGQAEGIGALIGNALGFNMNPTIIPGTPGSDARSQARQDRDIYSFDVPENMGELVSAALRDSGTVPETIDRGIFTTDDDSPSGAKSNNPPGGTIRVINTGGQDLLDISQSPTVAEILLNDEPTYTGPFTSQVAEDIYMSGADTPVGTFTGGTGTDDTEGATISRRDGSGDVTYSTDPAAPAPVSRELLGPATNRLRGAVDKFEDNTQRMILLQDILEELYPKRETRDRTEPVPSDLSSVVSSPQMDLTALASDELLQGGVPGLGRESDPSFARILESYLGPRS